jgi:hypothetical protein
VWNRSRLFFVSKAYGTLLSHGKHFKMQNLWALESGPFYVKGNGGPTEIDILRRKIANSFILPEAKFMNVQVC